jgi:Spy/CpxP family protein refolding chaperone
MQRKCPLLCAALAAVLVGLPAAALAQAPAQGPAPARPDSGRRMGGAADWLLAQRAQLNLTNDQVKKLEGIRSKYEKKNQPLREQIRKAWAGQRGVSDSALRDSLRSMSPDQRRQAFRERRAERRQFLSQHPEVTSAMKQLHANREAARKEAVAVLTPAQRDQLKALRRQRREEWRARMDSAGVGRHRWHRGGEAADSSGKS